MRTYQELIVAMRFGVVKRGKAMKFTADVRHQSTRPHEDDRFCTVPIEGDPFQVARIVADAAARRRYGDAGMSSFLIRRDARTFEASIGEYKREECLGFVRGVTIVIRLCPDPDDAEAQSVIDNYVPF